MARNPLECVSRYDKMEPGKRGPGWDIGERPLVPIPYIKLPAYKYVQAHQRDNHFQNVENFSSRPIPHGLQEIRERHAHQRRDGQGWKSKLHKVLDYRTVDELGLKPEQLVLSRKPITVPERLVVVEDLLRRKGGPEGNLQHHDLTPGRTESGFVLEGEYHYFRINVPRMMALEVRLVTISGDPDMYVCNRFPNPHQTQHTWKSAGVGDVTPRRHSNQRAARRQCAPGGCRAAAARSSVDARPVARRRTWWRSSPTTRSSTRATSTSASTARRRVLTI